MLQVLGTEQVESADISRRKLLHTGALGLSGLCAARPEAAMASDRPSLTPPGFGRAKRCLLLYIYGAWSQLDTFDPKPEAPVDVRGEFAAIDSCLPGVQVCEHLPRSSRVLNRCTLVRSMTHPYPIHNASYTLTGNPDTEKIEGRQRNPDQWPYIGGVVDYLTDRGDFGRQRRGLPVNVMLPWRQSLFARPNKRSGTFGGFLGTNYDPLWTEFVGEAPQGDPFREITPAGRFRFGAEQSPTVSLEALDRRRSLLAQFELGTSQLKESRSVREYDKHREAAIDFLAATEVRRSLNLDEEPSSLRDDYGMTLFGQACLCARRLLEADVKFVTVVWDEYGQTDESWDTHYDHHSRMKEFLLPAFDRAFSTLMIDLEQRGLLEDTLVLCLSEHGRTPQFYPTKAGAPGRGHWSRAYSQLFAGAGILGGQVVGSTDAIAGDVTERPVHPKDVLCTAYHLLGIDPRQELLHSAGRNVPLVEGGTAIPELCRSIRRDS